MFCCCQEKNTKDYLMALSDVVNYFICIFNLFNFLLFWKNVFNEAPTRCFMTALTFFLNLSNGV